jgi:hypothetical protein
VCGICAGSGSRCCPRAAYTGRPDFDLLERVASAVFDAGTTQIQLAIERRQRWSPPRR